MHLGKFFTIRVLLITALALLVLLIGAFVLAFVGFPIIVKLQVHKTVQLQTDTIQWDRFKKQPIDFAFKLHVFNVTNAYDVQNYGVLPDVSEVGPYHFTQSLERNISNIGDESVTYTQIRKVIFDDKNSGSHKKTDRVKIPNPALVVITQITSTIERIFAYGCLDMILPPNMREPFIDTDIETLAINGLVFGRDTDVKGPSCSIVRNLFIKRARLIKCVDVIENSDGSVKELRFSMLNFMQSKIDGIYTINRGINDINQLGNLMKWNGEDRFKYWGNPRSIDNDKCNIVRGTDGTIYPPQITTDKTFEIFQSDVCRLITISYNGTKTYKGIDGYVFTIGPNSLRSDYADPEQDCYCTKSTADQTGNPSCFLDGVMDAQPCFHAPLILSWPHFLYAEDYRNGVTGLAEPDPEVHKTFILVEPNTGTPLEGFKRVQFNFILRPVQFMPMTKNHPRTLIPFTWLEQGVTLTDELIDELDNKYFGQIRLVNGVKYGLIALFAAFFCINFVFLLRKKYCTKK